MLNNKTIHFERRNVMEKISVLGQVGLAFAEALKGKNGPLYMGIVGIGTLVLGWKFLDERYQLEGNGSRIAPLAENEVIESYVVEDNEHCSSSQNEKEEHNDK